MPCRHPSSRNRTVSVSLKSVIPVRLYTYIMLIPLIWYFWNAGNNNFARLYCFGPVPVARKLSTRTFSTVCTKLFPFHIDDLVGVVLFLFVPSPTSSNYASPSNYSDVCRQCVCECPNIVRQLNDIQIGRSCFNPYK